eukprot:scaffold66324_cov75-Phaeocystis_antarctica.AAC.2
MPAHRRARAEASRRSHAGGPARRRHTAGWALGACDPQRRAMRAAARALRQDFRSSCSRPLAMPISLTTSAVSQAVVARAWEAERNSWPTLRQECGVPFALSPRARAPSSERRSATPRMRWNTPRGAAGPPPGAPQRRARSSSRREILALHVLAASLTSLPPPQPALGRVDMHMHMHSARAYGPPACRTHLRRRAACPVAPLLHPRRTPASAYCGTVAPQALGRTTPLVGDSADQPPAGTTLGLGLGFGFGLGY